MQSYLETLHARLSELREGEVADYIPELARVDPDSFGIALATVDGNVYQVGDARQPLTVQSISKAITYGIALEDNGIDAVARKVGVEPSGEAFNSISLEPETGRPLNPMINAGAIAVTALIEAADATGRMDKIQRAFEQYTGHDIGIDESVYRSESETGHRNRAISHLLRNADILPDVPEEALDVYFRQCSLQVTARDLALMGACLANSGVNPITGVVALDQRYVEKVLSVMSTCGMYDYSGSWIFRVGMPAKSGVSGGIMAVLPGQFGLGVFSPRLDPKGNSVRGIRVCEQLSEDFGLHLFKVARGTSSSVLRAAYDGSQVHSRRLLKASEREVLRDHGESLRVYELQGELMFGASDSVIRTITDAPETTRYVILDFSRVIDGDRASARLLADLAGQLQAAGKRIYYTGTDDKFSFRRYVAKKIGREAAQELLRFVDRDRAMEFCEDCLIRESGAGAGGVAALSLTEQYLCEGMDADEIQRLTAICQRRSFAKGETIFDVGESGDSIYLVVAGAVDIVVPGKTRHEQRLATVRSGMSFGEFAMVAAERRSAQARAVENTECFELLWGDIDEPTKAKLLAALAKELARRLSAEAREMQVLEGSH